MITPKLRFPEFTDEWHVKKIGEITVQMQSGLSRKLSSKDVGLPVIRSNNIRGGKIDTSDIAYWFVDDPQGANTKNYVLNRDDLLVNFINSPSQIGKFTLYRDELNRDAIFTTNIMRLTFQEGIVPQFIEAKLSRKEYRDYIKSVTKPAVNQASFTTVDLKNLSINIPSFTEQQKIADFLTAVDKKIEMIHKRIELLKQYKKGVMQKIFTRKIRFRDGDRKDYPAWESSTLGDVIMKNNHRNRNLEYRNVQSVSNAQGFVNQTDYFNNHSVASKDLSNYYVIKKGVFAYNPSRIDVGSLAYKSDHRISVVSPLYICFRTKPNLLLDDYLLNWFKTTNFTKQMNRAFEGSVRNTLSYDALSKMYIELPQAREQQKIADFLSSIDNKIKVEETKLASAKKFKKALLQRMFV